jgi:phosphomannomutase
MARTGAAFGGEHSGHFYFRDFWRADSGMLAAMTVLSVLGTTPPGTVVSDLMAKYQRYVSTGEINTEVADVAAALDAVRSAFEGRGDFDDLDGLTVSTADWWFNVRPSNTEPLLRLNAEASDSDTLAAIRDEVLALIRTGAQHD